MRNCTLALIFALIAGNTHAAECDQSLQPISTPQDLAYQDRGDRCEGLYQQPVATTGLRILGFFGGPSEIAPNAETTFIFGPGSGMKQLSVESLRRRQYYRLDASFKGDQYLYTLDLIRSPEIDISSSELAVRLCIQDCAGLMPVLVPARVGSRPPEALRPSLVLRATEELTYLRVEISNENGEILMDEDVLAKANWSAWRPLEIPLTEYASQESSLTFKATGRGRSASQIDAVYAILNIAQ